MTKFLDDTIIYNELLSPEGALDFRDQIYFLGDKSDTAKCSKTVELSAAQQGCYQSTHSARSAR